MSLYIHVTNIFSFSLQNTAFKDRNVAENQFIYLKQIL